MSAGVNICRNIQRYWILRRICRSISGPCAHLTWTFSGFILVLHGLAASSRWSSAGCREVHKRTVFCRNIRRNIQRYWILRRICRSISCSASRNVHHHAQKDVQGDPLSSSPHGCRIARRVSRAAEARRDHKSREVCSGHVVVLHLADRVVKASEVSTSRCQDEAPRYLYIDASEVSIYRCKYLHIDTSIHM